MRKERRHNLTEKLPIAAIVIWVVVSLVFTEGTATILNGSGLLKSLSPKIVTYIGNIIGAVLFLLFMKAWYSPRYEGVLKPGLPMKAVLLAALPVILYSLIVMCIQFVQYDFYFNPSLHNILMALTAGFGEEVMLRVSIIPIAMGFMKSRRRVWSVPVITGLIFGLLHFPNVLAGASVENGILQAGVTVLVGFYYGALFVATGSAFPGIIMHSIYDFICFAGDRSLTDGIMTGTLAAWEIIVNIVLALALAISGAVILKKTGADRILAIWKDKWNH